MKSTSYAEQKSSALLNEEENNLLFKLLGLKCQTLATTVVQLFATDSPGSALWVKRDVGILCLVRDAKRRSYFFRLYCLIRNQLVWEHEIYNHMQYLAQRPFLHSFEAEECIVAFNFASENEASHMRNLLLEKLECKAVRRLENKNKVNGFVGAQLANQIPPSPPSPSTPASELDSLSTDCSPEKFKSSKLINSSKKFKKKNIKKDEISQPCNFVHVSHVGFDKNDGFVMDNIDDTMKQFFEKVGISENDLKDEKTLEYIYDFIEKHGGYDAVKQTIQQSAPVTSSVSSPSLVPLSNVPNAPSYVSSIRTAPLPPPSDSFKMHPAPPPPPSGPPPSNVLIQKNQRQIRKLDIPEKSVQQLNNGPAPPAPPPLPVAELSNRPIIAQSFEENDSATCKTAPDPRFALMEAIRSGTTLKHVEEMETKQSEDDSRGKLFNQIRQGVELKAVPPTSKSASAQLGNDLASALARALAERAERMHTDSSNSSDTDDSNNEWDD